MNYRTPAPLRGPATACEPEMQTESLQGSVRKSWLTDGGTEWQKVHPNGGCREDELSVSLACPTHQVGGNPQLPTPSDRHW